jgi:hypothetical protein
MKDNQLTRQEFESLVEALEGTPRSIRQLADDLAEVDARWKPSGKEWSMLELVCHLNDIEQEGYTVRIEKLLHETRPFLADIDGDRLAEERNYNGQGFETTLRAFTRAREANVRVIKALSPDQLNRSGVFENVGPVTLATLLQMMREHDKGHLQDLSSLRDRLIERRKSAPLSAAG